MAPSEGEHGGAAAHGPVGLVVALDRAAVLAVGHAQAGVLEAGGSGAGDATGPMT